MGFHISHIQHQLVNAPPGSSHLAEVNVKVCPFWDLIQRAEIILGKNLSEIMEDDFYCVSYWNSSFRSDDHESIPQGPHCECERAVYALSGLIAKAESAARNPIRVNAKGKIVIESSPEELHDTLIDYQNREGGVKFLETLTEGINRLRETEKEGELKSLSPLQVVQKARRVLITLRWKTMGIRKSFVDRGPGCKQHPDKLPSIRMRD